MRTLNFKRIYPLKQYENLTLEDTIDLSFLGKEAIDNEKLYNIIRYLQFIQTELAYRKYLQLLKEIGEMNLEESIITLENYKHRTIDEIKEIIINRIEKE
jgi:hypothetical protein